MGSALGLRGLGWRKLRPPGPLEQCPEVGGSVYKTQEANNPPSPKTQPAPSRRPRPQHKVMQRHKVTHRQASRAGQCFTLQGQGQAGQCPGMQGQEGSRAAPLRAPRWLCQSSRGSTRVCRGEAGRARGREGQWGQWGQRREDGKRQDQGCRLEGSPLLPSSGQLSVIPHLRPMVSGRVPGET